MQSQSEYFWEKLAEGEWQQRECQTAIIDAFPFIAVSSFGNAPTSAKTAARWGIDEHHTGAKPVIHHQRECLTAPDMMMVLENERYALEIKGKIVVEPYANVMLDEAEVTELENASDAIQMHPLFIFRLCGHDQPERIQIGDYDQRPDLSPFYCLTPAQIRGRSLHQDSNGVDHYRIPVGHLWPLKTFIEIRSCHH
tara:strand:- start:28 stop:615 length:588 start_codon:yes stop_codon:yes gene_type:complete